MSEHNQFSNIQWHIPEHDCEENKGWFVTRDDVRILCKVCFSDLSRSSASLPSSDDTAEEK